MKIKEGKKSKVKKEKEVKISKWRVKITLKKDENMRIRKLIRVWKQENYEK